MNRRLWVYVPESDGLGSLLDYIRTDFLVHYPAKQAFFQRHSPLRSVWTIRPLQLAPRAAIGAPIRLLSRVSSFRRVPCLHLLSLRRSSRRGRTQIRLRSPSFPPPIQKLYDQPDPCET